MKHVKLLLYFSLTSRNGQVIKDTAETHSHKHAHETVHDSRVFLRGASLGRRFDLAGGIELLLRHTHLKIIFPIFGHHSINWHNFVQGLQCGIVGSV